MRRQLGELAAIQALAVDEAEEAAMEVQAVIDELGGESFVSTCKEVVELAAEHGR